MNKAWKIIIILLIALGIACYLFAINTKSMLANSLSEKLKVPVSVESISFTLSSITIKGIEIDNLPQSILSKAFTAKKIIIKTPLINFLKSHLEINEILVEDIYVALEFDDIKSPKGNWTRLIENFYTKMDNDHASKSNRSVSIQKIALKNIKAQVVYKTNPSNIHTLPTVKYEEFTNINSEGGMPTDQIANSILGQMLMSLFVRENLQNMFKQFLNPKNVLKNALTPFKLLIPKSSPSS